MSQLYWANVQTNIPQETEVSWLQCTIQTTQRCVVCVWLIERLVKLMDYYEGSFQDFVGHSDKVSNVKFATSSKLLFTIADSELFVWVVSV